MQSTRRWRFHGPPFHQSRQPRRCPHTDRARRCGEPEDLPWRERSSSSMQGVVKPFRRPARPQHARRFPAGWCVRPGRRYARRREYLEGFRAPAAWKSPGDRHGAMGVQINESQRVLTRAEDMRTRGSCDKALARRRLHHAGRLGAGSSSAPGRDRSHRGESGIAAIVAMPHPGFCGVFGSAQQ